MQEPTAEAGVVHDVNETISADMSNAESLIDQENVSDQLKTIENENHEPEDAKVIIEQPRPVEFKVEEAPNNEM